MKENVRLDGYLQEFFNQLANIRGISLEQFVYEHLNIAHCFCSEDPEEVRGMLLERFDPDRFVEIIAEEIAATSYKTRREAEAVAERLEDYVIERQLLSDPDTGIAATEVVPGRPKSLEEWLEVRLEAKGWLEVEQAAEEWLEIEEQDNSVWAIEGYYLLPDAKGGWQRMKFGSQQS